MNIKYLVSVLLLMSTLVACGKSSEPTPVTTGPDPIDAVDTDNDGVADEQDAFPNDPSETVDTDNDGVGNNADVFPNDPSESADSDNDGVGNNADVFPSDPTETADTDNDGVGDNADAFPNDPTETLDSDGDGIGDNADTDEPPVIEDDSNVISETLTLSQSHPRIAITAEQLAVVLERAYGDNAVSPYQEWFTELKALQDSGEDVGLQGLALLFLATADEQYLERFFSIRPTTGIPQMDELVALDMIYQYVPDLVFLELMDRVAAAGRDVFIYQGTAESNGEYVNDWGYHTAYSQADALAYSLLIADHPFELTKDPEIHPYNARNFLLIAQQQLEQGGHFYQIERRISGDPTYNTALPGSFGGLYDIFSYDRAEESYSAYLYAFWKNATGSDVYLDALHDKHRGELYLSMGLPFTESVATSDGFCAKEGTVSGELPRIWDSGTTPEFDVDGGIKVFSATMYQDPSLQWFVENGRWLPNCRGGQGLTDYLLHYDHTLAAIDRTSMPTATYFSGPGLSVMRSDWQQDAAFGLFLAGEGISRRYQDANSFIIHRNDFVIKHSGQRIRSNDINDTHHWYHRLSASKNIIKVFDPNESLDVNADGTKAELYSGTPLVNSDNYGGQIPTHDISTTDGCYIDCESGELRGRDGFMFGATERADIVKYEAIEGEYVYTVGDATASYSNKVEYIEREFLFFYPDVFLIFDRFEVADPEFRKVWNMHAVAEPVISGVVDAAVWGKTSIDNGTTTTISQNNNVTYIDTLYPENNEIRVRGGDTEFVKNQTLASIESVSLDIPRWLELFVNGTDTEGTLTIQGATRDSDNDSEQVVFDGTEQEYFVTREQVISENTITVPNANWQVNQWVGYRVQSGDLDAVITANTADTLTGTWSDEGSSKLTIYRYVANTSKYWTRVDSVETSDMSIDDITISVPHYFDLEDVSGTLHTFAPHTDTQSANYQRDPNIGQYNMAVEATDENTVQHFVHVISLKDPGVNKPTTSLAESNLLFTVNIDNHVVVLAKDRAPLTEFDLSYNDTSTKVRLFNLAPNTNYYVSETTQLTLNVSTTDNGGTSYLSSDMGVVSFDLD